MKIALHVLSGRENPPQLHALFRKEGWQEKRLVGGLVALAGVPDRSVDGVWFAHQLAQLDGAATTVCLKHVQRVLRDGGILLTVALDAEIAARQIARGQGDKPLPLKGAVQPLLAQEVFYGPKGDAYRQCFTAVALGKVLKDAGFKEVQVTREQVFLWAAGVARPKAANAATEMVRVTDRHNPFGLSDYLDAPPQRITR